MTSGVALKNKRRKIHYLRLENAVGYFIGKVTDTERYQYEKELLSHFKIGFIQFEC